MPTRVLVVAVLVPLMGASRPDAGGTAHVVAAPAPHAQPELPAPPLSTSKRLDFRAGAPIVPVRLMEGASEVTVRSRAPLRLRLRGRADLPTHGEWRIRRTGGRPAEVLARVQLAELAFRDKSGIDAAEVEWQGKGVPVRVGVVGSVFGIAGKVIDNRRYVLLLDRAPAPPSELSAVQAELLTKHGVRTTVLEELRSPGQVSVDILDEAGSTVASTNEPVLVESETGTPIEVARVEFGVGYDFHGFEDRSFRGQIEIGADRRGTLAVVNLVQLEDLLKGLVPSEIYAKAPLEALKAQAVTARGEVLAKVGLKHLADPYYLCSEQHCAVYKGLTGEAASTNRAVEETRGEALFDGQGRLVDSVYSAVCGGHTENNEVVWGGVANPSLRGRPDLLFPSDAEPAAAKSDEEVRAFLKSDADSACKVSSFSNASKYRWERRFSPKEVDARMAPYSTGPVLAMAVTDRGVSGRARLLVVSGESGATTIRGELTIRKLFSNLNSSLFNVSAVRDAKGRPTSWVFTGGGWGHGVGLCQNGAIGRAEAGHAYQKILSHYFSGAVVAPLY